MKMSTTYTFFIDLNSIHNRLSSDYWIYVSRAVFLMIVNDFLSPNSYKLPIFERSVTCRFFRKCTHLVTRTQDQKFEDVFLVKIVNKGTTSKKSVISCF